MNSQNSIPLRTICCSTQSNNAWQGSPQNYTCSNLYNQLSAKIQQFQHQFLKQKKCEKRMNFGLGARSQTINCNSYSINSTKNFNIKVNRKNKIISQKENNQQNIQVDFKKSKQKNQFNMTWKFKEFNLKGLKQLKNKQKQFKNLQQFSSQLNTHQINVDQKCLTKEQNRKAFTALRRCRPKTIKKQTVCQQRWEQRTPSLQSLNNLIFNFIQNQQKNRASSGKIFNREILQKKLR